MGRSKKPKKGEKKKGKYGNWHFSLEILQDFKMKIPFQKEVNVF